MKEGDSVYCICDFHIDVKPPLNDVDFTNGRKYIINSIKNNTIFLTTDKSDKNYFGFSIGEKFKNWEFFNEYFVETLKELRKLKLEKINESRR